MAVHFKRTKKGSWAVVGPVAEVQVGPVEVETKAGKTKTVTVVGVGKPFMPKWAEEEHAYGYLSVEAPKAATEEAPADPIKAIRAAVAAARSAGRSEAEILACFTA